MSAAISSSFPEPMVQPPLWDELIEEQRRAEEEDDLYDDAVAVVSKAGRASVSLLQRRLRIGYSRAARLIDLMETRGVIGPDQGGSRGREVLVDAATVDDDFAEDDDHTEGPARVWY